MNSKSFAIATASILMLALFVSSASALTTSAFSYVNQSYPVSASGLGLFNITSIPSTLTTLIQGENFSTFSLTGTNTTLNIRMANINSNNEYYGGSYSSTFNVTGFLNASSNTTTKVPVTVNYLNSFCNYGDINASSQGLSMTTYITNDGTGTQTSWNPLDVIEVQVTVYNNGNTNFNPNNVYLEMGLLQSGTNNNIANRLDWISGDGSRVSVGNIPSGESYTYTFKFKVDPKIISTLNSGSSYELMVKAYSNSNGPNDACVDYSSGDPNNQFGGSRYYATDIQMSSPSYNQAVMIDPTTIPLSSTASCGQQVTFSPEVYNVGPSGNTYSKSQILVTMYSPLTGKTLNQTVYGGLNPGTGTQVPFTLSIPLNADEKQYPVYFNVYYGYSNTGNANYFNEYRYVSSTTLNTNVDVSGGCVYATPATTLVQAQLQSGGKSGEPLVIQATITNKGNQTANYNFGMEGYTSWSALTGISPLNVTLAPGQSQNVIINLAVNKDASGTQQFYLDTYSSGYLITQQPLTVTIEHPFSLASITGNAIGGGNWYLWGIGLINLILVVAIIIIIVRIARRK